MYSSEPWGGHTTERWPTHPSLLRSIKRGATARTYVHVHIRRRMTSRRDWKLNSADCKHIARARVRLVNASRPTARTHHSRVSHLRHHCALSKRTPYVGTSRTKACRTCKAAWTWWTLVGTWCCVMGVCHAAAATWQWQWVVQEEEALIS